MGWVRSEGLSALAGVMLLGFTIYPGTDGWLRGVLAVAGLAFVTAAFAQDQDYRTRILVLVILGVALVLRRARSFAVRDRRERVHRAP